MTAYLKWQLEIGKYAEKFARIGKTEVLENAPILFDDLQIVWEIFLILNQTRQVGFSACPLGMTDITNILDFFDIVDAEERREFLDYMLALDRVWLEHNSSKTDKK